MAGASASASAGRAFAWDGLRASRVESKSRTEELKVFLIRPRSDLVMPLPIKVTPPVFPFSASRHSPFSLASQVFRLFRRILRRIFCFAASSWPTDELHTYDSDASDTLTRWLLLSHPIVSASIDVIILCTRAVFWSSLQCNAMSGYHVQTREHHGDVLDSVADSACVSSLQRGPAETLGCRAS